MATKKQRRRREKLQRHEYEYVVETEEGEEVVDSPARAETGKAPQKGQPKLVDRRGREIRPPSWQRVLKRGAIFAPIMLALIFFMGGNKISASAKIVNALVLVAIFIPFSYLVDMFIYRTVSKRARQNSGR
jgi:hypothetical protein